MAETASLSITYYDPEEADDDGGAKSLPLTLMLDSDRNGGKSSFAVGENVYLLTVEQEPGRVGIKVEPSSGEVNKTGDGIPVEIEDEFITFTKSKTGSLQYPPDGSVSYEWIGNDGGLLSFEQDGSVKAQNEIIGVAKCTYKTLAKRWLLSSVDIEGTVVVVASKKESVTSVSITFEGDDAEDAGPFDVKIWVDDTNSGAVLPGAAIMLTASTGAIFSGTTDASGLVEFESVPKGTGTVKIEKSGYETGEYSVDISNGSNGGSG